MKQTTGREIKFRVFDKNIPKHEGELKKPTGKMVEWDYVKWSSYFNDGLSGRLPIMQYTGLKDKNGKEIYEGDIMKAATGESVYEVIWLHSGWFRKSIKGTWGITSLFVGYKHQTVVGNIYEHPNLLP